MKVIVRLSALRTITQGHIAAGRITSTENPSDTIGNRNLRHFYHRVPPETYSRKKNTYSFYLRRIFYCCFVPSRVHRLSLKIEWFRHRFKQQFKRELKE